MTKDLPVDICDLVCCLEENSSDDGFIVDVVLKVMAEKRMVYMLMAFLQTGVRSESEILQALQEL